MASGPTKTAGTTLGRIFSTLLAAALLLAACGGGDEEPELTFEDQLVELEGRSLTPAEVAERVEVGETLCQLDDQVLDELWQQLSDDQLDFQDLLIAELCPERAILYAGHTGRFVTDEAEESGVRTSTTRPTSTTASTSGSSTTRPRTTTTAGTGTTVDSSDSTTTSTTNQTSTQPTTSSTSTTAPTTTASSSPSPSSSE